MKDDLVYLPKADKIISLDDVESIEVGVSNKHTDNDVIFTIEIKKRDNNIIPPELFYKKEEDMDEDFKVIVDDINKSKQEDISHL